jgi:hypothetical protein
MAEFERVPLRPRPSRNWLPTAGLAFTVFLAFAIVKPWESSPATTAADPTARPTFFIRPTARTGPLGYDPRLFGGREPDPAWELWPAGYVVQFGLAGPVKVHGQDGASASPGAGAPEPEQSDAAPGASPGAAVPTIPPPGDGVVDLGPADHLIALGINTPLAVRVEEVRLSILEDDSITPIPLVRLPTLWESDHFIVVAPEDQAIPGQPAPWEPALYRLDLITAFGEVREIELRVMPPLD